jgi:hypothetical protein
LIEKRGTAQASVLRIEAIAALALKIIKKIYPKFVFAHVSKFI